MKDYSEFFTHVVANHLHKLVDLVGGSHSQKVLVHEWVLGIEYNWSAYVSTSNDDDSEFIPRLSFWIGGLRDQFNSNPSKSKVIELLNKTFDASTFCYFDYGARSDVEEQIEKYCKEVDDWFGEEILTPKLRKFKLSKDVIPLINSEIESLQRYGSNLSDSKIGISKDIRDASGLEKEFLSMFKTISKGYVKSMKTNVDWFSDIKRNLDSFLNSCNKLGYKDLLSRKQLSEIEEIEELVLIEHKNSLKLIVNDNFNKIKKFEVEIPEPEKYNAFVNLFSNSLKVINSDEILLSLYNIYADILKKNPKDGNKIIENISEFIKNIPNKYSTKNIQKEFDKIKDKAFLKIKIVNLFRIPKKEIEVIIYQNSKKLKTKRTNEKGEVMFDDVPKDELTINMIIGDKNKGYKIKIEDYYNEKTIWLFSL